MIEQIEVENFGRFRNNHIFDFQNKPIVVISGYNGSGKSLITSEAISVAFTGSPLRGKLEDLITVGEKRGKVRLKANGYILERVLGKPSSFKLYDVNNNNRALVFRKRELTEFIKKQFQFDKDIFLKFNLLSPFKKPILEQSKKAYIANEFVEVIFWKVFVLKQLKDILKKKLNLFKRKQTEIDAQILETQNEITRLEIQLNKLAKQLEVKENLQQLKEKLTNVSEKLDEYLKLKSKLLNKKSNLLSKIGEVRSIESKLKTQLNNYQKLVNQKVCPICKRPFEATKLKHAEQKIKELSKRIKTLEAELANYQKELNEIDSQLYKLENEISKLSRIKSTLVKAINSDVGKLMEQTESELNQLKTQLEVFKKLKREAEADYKTVQNLLNKVSENEIKRLIDIEMSKLNGLLYQFGRYLLNKQLHFKVETNKLGQIRISIEVATGNQPVYTFSTSELKRTELVLSLVFLANLKQKNKAFPVIVLDEFFDTLDIENIEKTLKLIKLFQKQFGYQVFITTNYLDSIQSVLKNVFDANEYCLIELER